LAVTALAWADRITAYLVVTDKAASVGVVLELTRIVRVIMTASHSLRKAATVVEASHNLA